MNTEQLERMKSGKGFIAALDQSGGSTPKALASYGIPESAYSGEEAMFDMVHKMRTRMITAPAFSSERLVGVILFEKTMRNTIEGMHTADYVWQKKGIVPFLKVDLGLEAEADGVQLMKPVPGLDALLDDATKFHVFGTKMRSVIKSANEKGVHAVVAQQFEWGEKILAHDLVPIIEPEVDIHAADKKEAEALLKKEILAALDKVSKPVMLKLTIPTEANFYKELIEHPKVIRVVALSGGYSREHANELLMKNNGMIASFSRALAEGLSANQSDEEFNSTMAKTMDGIYEASIS